MRLVIKVYPNREIAMRAMSEELNEKEDVIVNMQEMWVYRKPYTKIMYRTKQDDLRGIRADKIERIGAE